MTCFRDVEQLIVGYSDQEPGCNGHTLAVAGVEGARGLGHIKAGPGVGEGEGAVAGAAKSGRAADAAAAGMWMCTCGT